MTRYELRTENAVSNVLHPVNIALGRQNTRSIKYPVDILAVPLIHYFGSISTFYRSQKDEILRSRLDLNLERSRVGTNVAKLVDPVMTANSQGFQTLLFLRSFPFQFVLEVQQQKCHRCCFSSSIETLKTKQNKINMKDFCRNLYMKEYILLPLRFLNCTEK